MWALPGWCGDGIQSPQQMVRTGHNLSQSVPSDFVIFQEINTHSSYNRGSSSQIFSNPEWNAASLNIYCTLPTLKRIKPSQFSPSAHLPVLMSSCHLGYSEKHSVPQSTRMAAVGLCILGCWHRTRSWYSWAYTQPKWHWREKRQVTSRLNESPAQPVAWWLPIPFSWRPSWSWALCDLLNLSRSAPGQKIGPGSILSRVSS